MIIGNAKLSRARESWELMGARRMYDSQTNVESLVTKKLDAWIPMLGLIESLIMLGGAAVLFHVYSGES